MVAAKTATRVVLGFVVRIIEVEASTAARLLLLLLLLQRFRNGGCCIELVEEDEQQAGPPLATKPEVDIREGEEKGEIGKSGRGGERDEELSR